MLDEALKRSSSLDATIYGVTQRLIQVLGIKNLVHTMHNNPKQGIRATEDPFANYPHAWYRIQTMNYQVEAGGLPKNIGRFGSGWSITKRNGEGATNAIVFNNHYFPVTLNLTLTARFMQTAEALTFIQKVLIGSATEMMSFEIEMPTTRWTVRVLNEGNSVPFPNIEDLDNASSDPGVMEIEIPFIVMTKIGFNMELAKINNLGEITQNYEVDEVPQNV